MSKSSMVTFLGQKEEGGYSLGNHPNSRCKRCKIGLWKEGAQLTLWMSWHTLSQGLKHKNTVRAGTFPEVSDSHLGGACWHRYLWWHFGPGLLAASPECVVGLPPWEEWWTDIQKRKQTVTKATIAKVVFISLLIKLHLKAVDKCVYLTVRWKPLGS